MAIAHSKSDFFFFFHPFARHDASSQYAGIKNDRQRREATSWCSVERMAKALNGKRLRSSERPSAKSKSSPRRNRFRTKSSYLFTGLAEGMWRASCIYKRPCPVG